MKNKKFFTFLRIIISLAVLSFLLYKLDIEKIYKAMMGMSIWVVVLLSIRYVVPTIVKSVIIQSLARALKYRIKLMNLVKKYMTAYSFGLYSPGRIGDFSLILLLGKENVSYGDGAVITFIEKIMAVITLVIVGSIGFFIFFPVKNALIMLALLICAVALPCILIAHNKSRDLIKKYILRSYSSKFEGFSKSLSFILKEKKGVLSYVLLIEIISLLLNSVFLWIIFQILNMSIPFYIVPIISAIGMLSALIPISMAGLGIRETISIYLYSQINADIVLIGSVFIVSLFVYYIISGAIIILFSKEIGKEKFNSEKNKQNIPGSRKLSSNSGNIASRK